MAEKEKKVSLSEARSAWRQVRALAKALTDFGEATEEFERLQQEAEGAKKEAETVRAEVEAEKKRVVAARADAEKSLKQLASVYSAKEAELQAQMAAYAAELATKRATVQAQFESENVASREAREALIKSVASVGKDAAQKISELKASVETARRSAGVDIQHARDEYDRYKAELESNIETLKKEAAAVQGQADRANAVLTAARSDAEKILGR